MGNPKDKTSDDTIQKIDSYKLNLHSCFNEAFGLTNISSNVALLRSLMVRD